jgi:hypothetical protein
MSFLMVFDVESIGLHGEGYAVAYAVVETPTGKILETGFSSCLSVYATGRSDDRVWIETNVDPHLPLPTHNSPLEVREFFWNKWISWREKGATLYAQCGWPVEARFLAACVDDDFSERRWKGPFPLREITDFIAAAKMADPDWTTKIYLGRHDKEYPEHNPIKDTERSARILIEAQRVLWGRSTF